MLFTIFTPTYNRAHTLRRLYESLLSQSFKNFEWLIVDDGSTDETKNLVSELVDEKTINIRYVFQKNAGKHIAINTALSQAEGEWFFTVDSDDYLRENALGKSEKIIKSLPKDFDGFTGIHFSDKITFNPNDFGKKTWLKDGGYQWPHHGEMTFVWKTAVAKQYPFPVFEGEKFCQESLVLRRILAKHKVLWTDNVLVGGDYLPEGLTANLWKNMLKSPRYSMLNYSERMTAPNLTKAQKNEFAKNYWNIARDAKIPFREALNGLPLKYSAKYFLQKLKDKIRN